MVPRVRKIAFVDEYEVARQGHYGSSFEKFRVDCGGLVWNTLHFSIRDFALESDAPGPDELDCPSPAMS